VLATLSVKEFCSAHGLTYAEFHRARALGLIAIVKQRRSTRIPVAAAQAWEQQQGKRSNNNNNKEPTMSEKNETLRATVHAAVLDAVIIEAQAGIQQAGQRYRCAMQSSASARGGAAVSVGVDNRGR
jgi:hypothetical protein